MIDVTLLGTAAAAPTADRALSSAVLTCCGRTILFDCGDGTQTALRRLHISLLSIDVICLTHFHGDHVFGLPGLLQTMALHSRTRPVTLVIPQEDGIILPALMTLSQPLPFPLRTLVLPEAGLPLRMLIPGVRADAVLSPISTRHTLPSCGYRFDLRRSGGFLPDRARALDVPQKLWGTLQRGEAVTVDGRTVLPEEVTGAPRRGLSVVFTGDTRPCEALLEAARHADLLIMDATYAEDAQEPLAARYGHSTFAQAARLAAGAHVRRLWLTHFSGMIDDPQSYLPAAQTIFPACECGRDGMTISLSFDRDAAPCVSGKNVVY